jgi:hypothetical protein
MRALCATQTPCASICDECAVRIERSDRAAAVERAQLDKRLDALNEFRVQLQH